MTGAFRTSQFTIHNLPFMRVLGIDPGTATTGYGIIDIVDGVIRPVTWGVIKTPAKTPMADRLLQLHTELLALIVQYKPDTAGVEELFFGRNVTTAVTVGQARGVILLCLAQSGIPLGEYSPPKIKNAVAGYGSADKAQVQLMVRHTLDLSETPGPDDAADGLAIAITHYHQYQYNALIQD